MGKVMGKYCRAYLLKEMRKFKGWSENPNNARVESNEDNSPDAGFPRILDDDSIVYLQENYVVTDGVFKEENILFDSMTPEWEDYCIKDLGFYIPNYDEHDQPRH